MSTILIDLKRVAGLRTGDPMSDAGLPDYDWGPAMTSLLNRAIAEIEGLEAENHRLVRLLEASARSMEQ